MTQLRFLGALALLVSAASFAAAQVATPPMVGHWKGEAAIAVNWTKAKTLMVDLTISADDRVTGTIGDARLFEARLVRSRGRFARLLNVKTDYRIVGALKGPIIAAENIARASVALPLNWTNGMFEGGLATSGTELGGADSMTLTAGKLVLRRQPDMIICGGEPRP